MEIIRRVEHVVVVALLAMMMLVIVISTVELAYIIFQQFMAEPKYWLDIANLLEVFGFFLMVVIGLELLETIRVYIEENRIHVEVVMLVAIVAVARKVIIIDYDKIEPMMNFSIAALVLALSVGYFLIRRTLRDYGRKTESKVRED